MHLSIRPPENPTEDRLISLLDRGIMLSERADEMAAIRLQMHAREKARLRVLLRRVNPQEART